VGVPAAPEPLVICVRRLPTGSYVKPFWYSTRLFDADLLTGQAIEAVVGVAADGAVAFGDGRPVAGRAQG